MRNLCIFLSLLWLTACGPKRNEVRIRGQFENLPQADLLLYSPDGGLNTIDTLHIIKGKFDYSIHVEGTDPYTYTIVYPNFMTLSFLARPGSDVRIKGDAQSLSQVKVEGVDSVLPAERKQKKNPLVVGKQLPKSKLIKPDPKNYLLISFWAEWKHGSSTVNYYTRRALEEHTDSLKAFTYSLDVDPKMGRVTEPRTDTLRWKTYCDYTGWGGTLVAQYGLRNIPLMILVSPKGKILAMGNDYIRDIKPEMEKIGD